MAQNFCMPITLSNINRFSAFLHWYKKSWYSNILTLKIPPHLIGVVTLPCEMSDITLKLATTMTNCMINVDWAWHVASKQPELKSRRLCCLRGFFIGGLSMLRIYDNSKAPSGANCRSIWLIAVLVSEVAGFSESSSSKTDILNILIWKLWDVAVTLDNNWGNKQIVCC